MVNKTVFTSMVSFADATYRAQAAGYMVAGYGTNKRGEFVVFARR